LESYLRRPTAGKFGLRALCLQIAAAIFPAAMPAPGTRADMRQEANSRTGKEKFICAMEKAGNWVEKQTQ
jgi:hypothetical protein